MQLLGNRFRVVPTSNENEIARETIEATSVFGSRPLDRIRWHDLDHGVPRRLLAAAGQGEEADASDDDRLGAAALRGLVWSFGGSRTNATSSIRRRLNT